MYPRAIRGKCCDRNQAGGKTHCFLNRKLKIICFIRYETTFLKSTRPWRCAKSLGRLRLAQQFHLYRLFWIRPVETPNMRPGRRDMARSKHSRAKNAARIPHLGFERAELRVTFHRARDQHSTGQLFSVLVHGPPLEHMIGMLPGPPRANRRKGGAAVHVRCGEIEVPRESLHFYSAPKPAKVWKYVRLLPVRGIHLWNNVHA